MKPYTRLLLTNDDGIDAPGIAILEEIAAQFAEEVWVIAPAGEQSGACQRVTLTTPVRCLRRDERHIAVEGTPADCVAIALDAILKHTPPDMVWSGINAGANAGDDVNLSGTLGACATAQMMGFRSFAFSQEYKTRGVLPWDTARALGPSVVRYLRTLTFPEASCVSVNFPNAAADEVSGMRWAPQGTGNELGVHATPCQHPRGFETYWMTFVSGHDTNPDGLTDLDCLARGEITLSLFGPNRLSAGQGTFVALDEILQDA